jgi:hypothetical protein
VANPTVRVGFLGDASQLAREAKRAETALAGVDRRAHTTSTALGTAFGTVAGKGIAGIAGAARNAVGSVGALASASIAAASDMNESLSKNAAVFGSSADAVKAWAGDNTKNILLTKQAAIEGAATFGNLFTALGIGQTAAAGLSTSLVGLASDLSSFNNVGTADALDALKSGLLGEAEPLRKFGVTLSAARIEAEAFSLGLAKPVKNAAAIQSAHVKVAAATANLSKVQKEHGEGTLAAAQAQDTLDRASAGLTKAMGGQKVELTAAQKAQAAYSIILKDTKTAQGDAARTSSGYANSTKILHKNIGDLEASIGQKLLPHALRLTHAVSDLVVEFDNGTGAGGRLREDLGHLGGEIRDAGEAFKPVLGGARWFVEHPDAFKAAAVGMAAFATASKAAAIWNARLAAASALPAVAGSLGVVAKTGPGAAAGIAGVGTASKLALPEVALLAAALAGIYETWKNVKGFIDDQKAYAAMPHTYENLGTNAQRMYDADPDLYVRTHKDFIPPITYVPKGTKNTGPRAAGPVAPGADDSHPGRGRGSQGSQVANFQTAAQKAAAASKAATDKAIAGEKYAADQAEAAAKRKADAADALQAATDKLRDALQNRLDTAKGIRDSLVSSNSVVRDGVSWTAKDLLSRFTVTMGKVKRFQSALSTLVAKGYDPTIVQQVANAGVQGGLGTAVGLAHASAGQVGQFNATQRAINSASGLAGNRVASQMGPIQFTSVLKVNDRELARAVNTWNAENGPNGHRLAS